MKPLRIVLVTIEPPLPFGNAAARGYYVLLKGLVERGHRVTAFAACSRPDEIPKVQTVFPAPQYDLRCYPVEPGRTLRERIDTLRRPYSYVFSDALRRDLNAELARGFDLLHLEHHWSGWLGLDHADRALLNIHYLFDIDRAGEAPTSLSERVRGLITRRGERYLLRRFPHISTLSPRLSRRVQEINKATLVHTIPLGIDASLYPFSDNGATQRQPVIGLIGSFNWSPTYLAGVRLLTRLWPEIKRRVPEARLQIVGHDARTALRSYQGMPDVSIHENVPDILPYFQSSDLILYAPGRGSGMKVKIMEAFALGVPVVTTQEGVEGMPAADGVHAGIAEDDQGLIDRAVAVLQDPHHGAGQRRAARQLLEAHCGPAATLDAVEAVYQRCL